MSSTKVFREDRVFNIGWGIFTGVMVLFLAGIILAPLLKYWGIYGLSDFLYRFYHIGCHQLDHRSWFLCGQKMGVCVRCFSTYLFIVPASIPFFIDSFRAWISKMHFLRFVLPVSIILLSPLMVDGFIQLLTSWESTNLIRFITGAMMGAGLAFLLGYLFIKFSQRIDSSVNL
jgi:uncharacterized membrane protein